MPFADSYEIVSSGQDFFYLMRELGYISEGLYQTSA